MQPASSPETDSSFVPRQPPRRGEGRIITFASAKGGTGKTVLAVSTATMLLRSGQRVLCVDGDFSTRGLSLFILGNILYSPDWNVRPEQCLAEFVLAEIPEFLRPKPRTIEQYGVQFDIILSNRNLWRSGVPDQEILSLGTLKANQYISRMTSLLDAFRDSYDYIIIDTRGGYDFTSGAPILLADTCVLVLEPDKISLEQMEGFNQALTALADTHQLALPNFGFIINKASFNPTSTEFPEDLARRHFIKTYGIIPADISCIRAYEVKDDPLFRFPDSDYTYWFLQAFRNLINPKGNWEDDKKIRQFEDIERLVHTGWASRKKVDLLLSWAPFLQLAPIVIATLFYFLFHLLLSDSMLYASYASLAVFILWSMFASLIAGTRWLRWREVSRVKRWIVTGSALVGILSSLPVMMFDVPRNIFILNIPQALLANRSAIEGIKGLQASGLKVVDGWKDLANSIITNNEERTYGLVEKSLRDRLGISNSQPLPDTESRVVASLTRQIIENSRQQISKAADSIKAQIVDNASGTIDASEVVKKALEHPRLRIDYKLVSTSSLALNFPSVVGILDNARQEVLASQSRVETPAEPQSQPIAGRQWVVVVANVASRVEAQNFISDASGPIAQAFPGSNYKLCLATIPGEGLGIGIYPPLKLDEAQHVQSVLNTKRLLGRSDAWLNPSSQVSFASQGC
jgi:cellulose biosynthesis protein BcsQ